MSFFFSQRLEGGLFCLQQLSAIIAFVCVGDRAAISRAEATLGGAEMALCDVQAILREAAAAVIVSSADDENGQEEDEEEKALKKTRQRYIEWGAALGVFATVKAARNS